MWKKKEAGVYEMGPVKNRNEGVSVKCADFEFAISETKFGVFNLLLLLAAIPSILAAQFETSSLSYVFPAARCDLDLSLNDRGMINAFLYAGMITSCLIWGSLVDVFGRRKILIIFHFVDCIFVLMAAFAPNLPVLVIAKFLGGFIINGPTTALTPYLSEFHGTEYRSRVPLIIGLLYTFGNIVLPLLAWVLLPLKINVTIFNFFEFHSWNLFLLLCVLPAFVSGVIFMLLPESPKYSMSKGDNERAMKTFKKLYRLNARRSPDEYPVTKLKDEQQIQKSTSFKEAWEQISPLFSSKYRKHLILVCLAQISVMMCVNSFRLWLPEIFQMVNDYEKDENQTVTFCSVLDTQSSITDEDAPECSMNFNNSSVYINSVVVASSTFVGYILAAIVINKVGKKKLLITLALVSGMSIASVFFTPNATTALILICIFIMCSCICTDIVVSIVVDLFPTSLRASALSLVLTLGRAGALLGNLLLPVLIGLGCAPLFFTQGCITIGCAVIAVFLPKTDLQALE